MEQATADSPKASEPSGSAAAAAAAEGASAAVDEDYSLTLLASEEFKKGSYDKCLKTLDELDKLETCNPNTRHQNKQNRALAEFYKSDCKEYEKLLQALNELDVEEATPNPTLRYNKAIIYYHRHMYNAAMVTLQPLIDKLETIEASLAADIGLLLLYLLLSTQQLEKAQAFLEHITAKLNLSAIDTEETVTSDGFNRAFKLLSLLTNVLNKNVVAIPDDGSIEFAELKAHQYYIMKDFQMAAKQLQKITADATGLSSADSNALNTCIANNMGVIHLRVRHYALAATFFQNAINFDKHIATNIRKVSLQQLSNARSIEILYNLGISMLHLRRPKEAFQCLLMPLKAYHNNPRLWFRLAEACIMDFEMTLLEQEKQAFAISVVDANTRPKFKPLSPRVSYSSNNQSAAVPEPTMEFASLSLRNALTLTKFYATFLTDSREDSPETATCSADTQRDWRKTKDNNYCSPSKPVSKKSLDLLLACIYAAYSYVSLRLGDYVIALEMAEELLKTDKISDAHKMLGHMYAGEALIMLDRLSEARPHLEPTFVSSLNAFDFETKDWQVKSLDAAQNIVRYNLAVALTVQGELEMAKGLLSTCTHTIVATKVKCLHSYLMARGV